jgi:hypothetical protein
MNFNNYNSIKFLSFIINRNNIEVCDCYTYNTDKINLTHCSAFYTKTGYYKRINNNQLIRFNFINENKESLGFFEFTLKKINLSKLKYSYETINNKKMRCYYFNENHIILHNYEIK